MDVKEIVIDTMNWIDSAQDRDYWRAFVNVGLFLGNEVIIDLNILV